uniref:Speckle-type POZ protein n=1 Tax=Oryza punctata TaxID=4537 RepID=A0A0E0LUR6_ORYPU
MAAAASTVPPSSSTSSPPQNTMSTHSTELVKGTHLFTVAGYSLQKRKGARHYIRSGSFEVGGYSWVVKFYPAGDTNEEGHVSASLELESNVVEKVTARFRFRVNGDTASEWVEFVAFTRGEGWGHPTFMKIETVESDYLTDDCLTLLCDVEVVKTVKTGATISRFITVPPPAICRHLEQLLESKEGSDVTFQVEQSEYDAHRAVLAARSPVFSAQFFGPMADQVAAAVGWQHVRIHDIKPAVFEAVLHFIYTDTLPPATTSWTGSHGAKRPKLSDVAAAACSKEDLRVMVGEWLAAADRFDLERMRLLCENTLCETIDVANAVATLRLADRHHCPQLKEFCMEYIASPGMLAAMMSTEGFRELKLDCPSLLIEILEKVGSCTMKLSASTMAAASNVPPSSSTSSSPHNTTSTHTTELVKGTHQFTVAGFSLLKRNGAGHFAKSGSFDIGGYSWAVLFYAAGEKKEDEGHVSVFLELQSTAVQKVTVKYTFHISGSTGISLLSVGWSDDFKPTSKRLGFNKFMDIETVEKKYLMNDRVTIHCAVEVVREKKTGATVSRRITVPPPAICRHLEQLLETKKGSDVTLQVERSKYDVHKAVLAARSPAFRAQFFGPMKAANKGAGGGGRCVRILDMKPAAFEAVLHFVYTDMLPPVEEEGFLMNKSASHLVNLRDAAVGCSKEEVRVMVREWLAAANRFGLERMRLLCENALCESIDVANAAATLRLADRHHCPQLKEFCMEYIASPGMLAAVMATEGFKELKGTHLFTVVGYSLQKRKGAEHSIRSGSFEVGGYSWVVLFYPAGNTKEEEGHVSVFLELRSTVSLVEKVTARSRFRVNGATAGSSPWGQFNDFTPSIKAWGCGKFKEIETVESEYLINDCLAMHCDVEVVKESETGATVSCFITVPPPGLSRHLEQLLESKQGSDVTFHVEQSEYDAHRAVLAVQSPVFSAQFFGPIASDGAPGGGAGGNGDGRQLVRIHDMKPAVFEAVLHFVYTDTLPPVKDLHFLQSGFSHRAKLVDAASGCSREDLRVMVGEWLAAADLYDLRRMRLLCENELCRTIDVANAAATLRLADRHHCQQLKAFCVEYVASPGMLAAVVATDGFRELKASCPSLLADLLEKLGSCSLE